MTDVLTMPKMPSTHPDTSSSIDEPRTPYVPPREVTVRSARRVAMRARRAEEHRLAEWL